MERRRGSQKSLVSTGNVPSDTPEDEEDFDSSDDDDLYLDPGEPFGAFLSPAVQPYDRRERVELLNQNLQNTQPPIRRQPIRVRFREELNQYFFDGSDSDSIPGDDVRVTRPSTRISRPPSPRYPSAQEKQRSGEGQRRPSTGIQRPPSSRRGLDDPSNNYKR